MSKVINLLGRRFGSWLVVGTNFRGASNQTMWPCRCDCGTERNIQGQALRAGTTHSCGCKKLERCVAHGTKHGGCGTRTYNSWTAMKQRCNGTNSSARKWYVPRGIKFCERWNNFANFLEDMGEAPPGMSLDRINNDGNYEPGNCRWATPVQQAQNRRPPVKRKKKLSAPLDH